MDKQNVTEWLGLRACTAGGMGSTPGWGTKIPHGTWCAPSKQTSQQKPNYGISFPWIIC